MSQEEILNKIIKLLQGHLGVDDYCVNRGPIRHHPYKSDFFELFCEAYNNKYFDYSSGPSLTGDAIANRLLEELTVFFEELINKSNDNNKIKQQKKELLKQQKDKLLKDFLYQWDEWRYVLDSIHTEHPIICNPYTS